MRIVAVLFAVAFVVAACNGGDDEGGPLVAYERVWPDGFAETTEIFEDGRVSMFHGESLERFTLDAFSEARGACTVSISD